jgi:hypothetical protein
MIAFITGLAEPIYGSQAHSAAMQQFLRSFPDMHVNTPYPIQFGSGDWITVVTNVTGTFIGEMTLPDGNVIAPTGKAFDLEFGQTTKWHEMRVCVQTARVPLDQALKQRTGAGRLPAVAQLDRLQNRVRGVRVFPTREHLLELELQTRTADDHLHEAHLEHSVWLPPILVRGIPDPPLVEPQRAARYGNLARRVDQPRRINPTV